MYLDKDRLVWRGFDGTTFTDWETFIIKHKVADIDPIEDPSTATLEDVANKLNELINALKS